jgi:hypothetical protein
VCSAARDEDADADVGRLCVVVAVGVCTRSNAGCFVWIVPHVVEISSHAPSVLSAYPF